MSGIKTTWLADIFNWVGDTFEEFNPAAFKFLSATLPYLTPLPVAVLTSKSASTFLEFDSLTSGIFVFALEGMGLWFTSLFVDAVLDVIRSRNKKSIFIVLLFGLVIAAYVYILVTLNVTLKMAGGDDVSPLLSEVVTLLCFLPLLSGVGNGYYKNQQEVKENGKKREIRTDEKEVDALAFEAERDAKALAADREYKLERLRIKQKGGGQTKTQGKSKFDQSLTESESNSKKNWRQASKTFTPDDKLVLLNETPVEVQKYFGLASIQSAINWKKNGERFAHEFSKE